MRFGNSFAPKLCKEAPGLHQGCMIRCHQSSGLFKRLQKRGERGLFWLTPPSETLSPRSHTSHTRRLAHLRSETKSGPRVLPAESRVGGLRLARLALHSAWPSPARPED